MEGDNKETSLLLRQEGCLSNNNTYYKRIALGTSIINLIISLIIYISFDFSSNQIQFVTYGGEMGGYSLYLGVDGLSIYFVVRPLIDVETSPL